MNVIECVIRVRVRVPVRVRMSCCREAVGERRQEIVRVPTSA